MLGTAQEEQTSEFDWGLFRSTGNDDGLVPRPPETVKTPYSNVVAIQLHRYTWNFPEDKRKHSDRTIVPGHYVGEGEPSFGAENLSEYALGPDNLGSRIIEVRHVERGKRAEIRKTLKENGYKGRVFFWK